MAPMKRQNVSPPVKDAAHSAACAWSAASGCLSTSGRCRYTQATRPSAPYSVIIDGKRFCANIKIHKGYVHFHLVCGYDPLTEHPGSDLMFKSHRRHVVMRSEDVFIGTERAMRTFRMITKSSDWDRFYRHGDHEGKHFLVNPKRDEWDAYQWYVDWLVDANLSNRKKRGLPDHLLHRTEGETVVKNALRDLDIRYVPEYIIDGLVDDTKTYRLADFYLPKEDIYIEFNGSGELIEDPVQKEEHVKRYAEKRRVYKKNGFRLIEIYPTQLGACQKVLSEAISQWIKEGRYNSEIKKIKEEDMLLEKDAALQRERAQRQSTEVALEEARALAESRRPWNVVKRIAKQGVNLAEKAFQRANRR